MQIRCASCGISKEVQRDYRTLLVGSQRDPPPPLVVGILVITPGPVVLVVLTGWIKGGNMNTRIRSLFSSHLIPGERQSLHLLLFDLMWNQMPENLKKFFYRQGSGHIFLLQG